MADALAGLVTAAATATTTATTTLSSGIVSCVSLTLVVLVVSRVCCIAARYYTAVLVGGL